MYSFLLICQTPLIRNHLLQSLCSFPANLRTDSSQCLGSPVRIITTITRISPTVDMMMAVAIMTRSQIESHPTIPGTAQNITQATYHTRAPENQFQAVLRCTKTISRSDSHPTPEKFALRIPTHTTPHTLRACACRFAWVASRSRHL